MQFHFGKWGAVLGYPLPQRSSGIMGLGEIPEIIYGAQQLGSKILSRKDLALVEQFQPLLLSPWLLCADGC